MLCEQINDYFYYCVTVYAVVTICLIKHQEKQEAYLKNKLKQERQINNDLMEIIGLKKLLKASSR